MRKVLIVVGLLFAVAQQASAWNDKGHMVIARLAWLRLDEQQRRAASELLRSHPHYAEYLAADRPAECDADEWAFMRASYWPDWVRSNHSEQFNQPSWHYITAAFVPPRSTLRADSLTCATPNVVTQIPFCVDKIQNGAAEERPIYLCWLLHLVGDIHQPLHCCSLLSEAFPEGDRGGNLSLVRIMDAEPAALHPTWDNLLGTVCDLKEVQGTADELRKLEPSADEQALWNQDHTAAADWSKHGFALAKRYAYLDGDLSPANVTQNPAHELVPALTPAYLAEAQQVARKAAARASARLANSLKVALAPRSEATPSTPSADGD